VFIDFLPKYIGMERPEPQEPDDWGKEKEKEEETPPAERRPPRPLDGRRPCGEYFTRNIDPARIAPWTDR